MRYNHIVIRDNKMTIQSQKTVLNSFEPFRNELIRNVFITFYTRKHFWICEKELILEAMRKAGEPLNAGKVAELTGLDRKVVDKAFAAMKKEGSIVSPVRCKWEPAEK